MINSHGDHYDLIRLPLYSSVGIDGFTILALPNGDQGVKLKISDPYKRSIWRHEIYLLADPNTGVVAGAGSVTLSRTFGQSVFLDERICVTVKSHNQSFCKLDIRSRDPFQVTTPPGNADASDGTKA